MFIISRKVRAGVPVAFFTLFFALPAASHGQITPPPLNGPPTITSIAAEQFPGKKFRVFGVVSDENPGSCGVIITGAGTGGAFCDSEGNFSTLIDVAALGNIQAMASDGHLTSAQVTVALTNAAPTINNFIAVSGPNNSWTFSGTVTDEAPAGLTVTLTGAPGVNNKTATVAANGSWSVTVTLKAGASGNVTATVVDWYGLSGVAYTAFGS